MGYMGAAWATLICYASMMIASFYIGQKHYPVGYDIRSFFFYIFLALMIWGASIFISEEFMLTGKKLLFVNTLLMLVFIAITWVSERKKISYLRR
jgi:Na+-driven multidrug efflux pump